MNREVFAEKSALSFSGWIAVFTGLLCAALFLKFFLIPQSMSFPKLAMLAVLGLGVVFSFGGLTSVEPNETIVLQLFGDYVGSIKKTGLRWNFLLCTRRRISTSIRNFETGKIKVNDADGNPIEIGAIVVWRIENSAEATFQVANVEHFIQTQSEAALRKLAMSYPYDSHASEKISLRENAEVIIERLTLEIQERLSEAGVQVIEARISHLAYAPEIAASMLQRQQANAIIAARKMIVEGAVGMVENALELLAKRGLVELDNERKATMVSNLLVVLCGDKGAQPVINAGTLYT